MSVAPADRGSPPIAGFEARVPFAVLTPCLVCGIAAAGLSVQYSPWLLGFGAAAFAAAAGLALRRDKVGTAASCALAALTVAAAMNALAVRDARPSSDVAARLSNGELPRDGPVRFEGCVLEDPVRRDDEIYTTVELRAVEADRRWSAATGIIRLLVGSADVVRPGEGGFPPRRGDRLRGWLQWSVPRNFGNPGAVDRVASLRRRGIRLTGRVRSPRVLEIVPGDCSNLAGAVLNRVREASRRGFEQLRERGRARSGAVLSSLVLGDYSGLDSRTREAFQNSGTYHVLVVSGLHVAWIANVLVSLFRAARFPQAAGSALAMLAVLAYTVLVGFQASITRALWMFLFCLLAQAIFRRSAPANLALGSAFVLLSCRPEWLLDAGFQLSFLAVLGICVTAVPVQERWLVPLLSPLASAGDGDRIHVSLRRAERLGRRLRFRAELFSEALGDRLHPTWEKVCLSASRGAGRAGLAVGGMLIVSLSVQLWLEPLLAFHFNRLSWIAAVANLALVPLSSAALAAGVLAAIVAQVPWIGGPLLDAAAFAADLLASAAAWVSSLPWAWQRCPTPSAYGVAGALLSLYAWWAFDWRRRALSAVPALTVLAILAGAPSKPWLPPGLGRSNPSWQSPAGRPERLSLTFLDVGQGDSALVRFPAGRAWLVDAGGVREMPDREEAAPVFDVGEAVVSRHLWWVWVRGLDRLVLTHSHRDHAGGFPAVLRNFPANGFDFAGFRADPALREILAASQQGRVPTREVESGERFSVDGVDVTVLHPPRDGRPRPPNDCSVVLRLSYGDFQGLLTGDIERAAEAEILARELDLRSVLLKVAHHGGRSSSLDGFLDAVRPRWGVVSAGRNNPFGHPAKETVSRLLRHGVRPLVTADHGAVHFETDGSRYILESHVCGVLETGSLGGRRSGTTTLPDTRPR